MVMACFSASEYESILDVTVSRAIGKTRDIDEEVNDVEKQENTVRFDYISFICFLRK
jgi:hypothetical protein